MEGGEGILRVDGKIRTGVPLMKRILPSGGFDQAKRGDDGETEIRATPRDNTV